MTETYSVATLGNNASSPFVAQSLTLPDSSARVAGEQAAMMTGNQIQCKGPDGSLKWYTIDAERSRPGGPIYLLAVGP
jgi:hypothetical protein